MLCDLPRTLAPDMFRYTDAKDHCYVYKQPDTAASMARMISAMHGAEVYCVRCRSEDLTVIERLSKEGLREQCDFAPPA